jgi:hypothetical protein
MIFLPSLVGRYRSSQEAYMKLTTAEILRQFYFGPRLPLFGPKTVSGPRRWASSAEMSRSDMPLCGDADTTARREQSM